MENRTTSSDQPAASAQEGFTLAALIVILTIISIVIAYTVPTQWSLVMRRERDRQTIHVMKQFALAIDRFEAKHKSLPVSLDQLEKARETGARADFQASNLYGKLAAEAAEKAAAESRAKVGDL